MDATSQAALAHELAAGLREINLSTQIWTFDHNTDHPEYPASVLANTSREEVQAVAWHCYASGLPDAVWAPLRQFAAQFPNVTQVRRAAN